MGLSIANILLQVTGDSDDARRELEAVSRDLALFGRETAEAEADLDTTPARANLEELEAHLADFSADDHSAEVSVLIAKAQADIAVLQAELTRIDNEEVTVDVDVRRGVVEKIASLTGQIERIGEATDEAAKGGIRNFVSGIGEAFSGASIFGVSLKTIAIASPFVLTALIALVGQLVAVVASAASAAGGIGALAVAFVSALIPGIALAVGAIANFAQDAEIAGTAAHALKGSLGEVATAFKDATAGGSNALFRGLSDGLREVGPLIDHLGPAFTRLGEAGGDAIRALASQFSSPAWEKFFTFTTDSLAKLTPLFAQSFGAFANILKNIATAAMPFLVKAFQGLADGLDAVAEKTSDIGGLREVIGGMVDSLRSWGELLGGLTDLTAAFVEAFAPFGDSIVESLADGAHNLADWLRSSDGLEEIKQFFETTGPLASELAELVLKVSLALIQMAELIAPALTPVVSLLNDVFDAANKALDFIVDHAPAVLRAVTSVIAPITLLKDAFGPIKGAAETALSATADAFDALGGAIVGALSAAVVAVVNAASSMANQVVEAVLQRVGQAQAAGRAIFDAVRDGFNAVRSAVIGLAQRTAQATVDVVRARIAAARAAGQAVFNAVRAGINAVRGAITGVARSIAQAAVAAVRALVGAARAAGQSVMNAVQAGFNAVRSAVIAAARAVAAAAIDTIKAAVGVATAAGVALINGVASGIRSAIGKVTSAASAIWDAINSALPDITVDIKIPTPHMPDIPGLASGVRNMAKGAVRLVGEEGPELQFIPTGSDVFTTGDTQRILRSLAAGASLPAGGGAPALAGGAGGDTIGEQNFNFFTPGTGSPDPRIAMAQAALYRRQKGRRA